MSGRVVMPGYFVWNRDEYDDGRFCVPLSVANGRYAFGSFHDIFARLVISRCLLDLRRVDNPR